MMDIDDQFEFGHLLLHERRCRVCTQVKDLVTDFYKTRKGSGPSSYSYECKDCTKERIATKRQQDKKYQRNDLRWYYPDW
jgi:uncharacterized protein YlaI